MGTIRHLSHQGKVTFDDTPKGIYIRYIDRDELLKQVCMHCLFPNCHLIPFQEQQKKKVKAVLDDEERLQRSIEEQKARANELAQDLDIVKPTESTNLIRDDPTEKISISFGSSVLQKKQPVPSLFEDDEEELPQPKEDPKQPELPKLYALYHSFFFCQVFSIDIVLVERGNQWKKQRKNSLLNLQRRKRLLFFLIGCTKA